MAIAITNELARYQDLRVMASQSALKWKGRQLDAREVGRNLKVRFLVAGSLRKEVRTIKTAVRLIDTLNGMQIWGEQYRRKLRADTLIALQEEIAQKVAAKIGSEYGIIPRTLSKESRKKPPESLETYEAFLRYYHYVTIFTPAAFAETLHVMEHAINRDPECGLAWSLLASLYCENYTFNFSTVETPLAKALAFARAGVSLEPQNQLVRATMAYLHFLCNERDSFLQEAEKALALNPNAPALIGFLGWLLALYGEWERGIAILSQGMELNPHHPGWFHMAPYFNFYRQGKYADSYQEALQFQMPQLFWDPLLRAAALGQLGKEREAAAAVAELLALRSDFLGNPRFLIRCYVKFTNLANTLLDGLRKANLKI